MFACFVFCLLMAVNRGNDLGWSSPLVLGFGAATLVQGGTNGILRFVFVWNFLRSKL